MLRHHAAAGAAMLGVGGLLYVAGGETPTVHTYESALPRGEITMN